MAPSGTAAVHCGCLARSRSGHLRAGF